MRLLATVLLAASSVFAYQVTYPGDTQGWNNTGPNYLMWQRVATDPVDFTVVLTNQNIGYDEVLDTNIDGTLGSVRCSTPPGGWPSGSGFRVNLAQDANNLNSLLAQSNQFNITAVNGSTTTSPTATSSSTSSASSVSSSQTSTSPTGTNAASFGAEAHAGLITTIAAFIVFITTLF